MTALTASRVRPCDALLARRAAITSRGHEDEERIPVVRDDQPEPGDREEVGGRTERGTNHERHRDRSRGDCELVVHEPCERFEPPEAEQCDDDRHRRKRDEEVPTAESGDGQAPEQDDAEAREEQHVEVRVEQPRSRERGVRYEQPDELGPCLVHPLRVVVSDSVRSSGEGRAHLDEAPQREVLPEDAEV
jgi:hypothetical protein